MDIELKLHNWFNRISLKQFKETAIKLENELRNVSSGFSSQVFLTMNEDDYFDFREAIIPTSELTEMYARIERYSLPNLNQRLWENAFKRVYLVQGSNSKYVIWLSNEFSFQNHLFLQGSHLDGVSLAVLYGLKEDKKFIQTIKGCDKEMDSLNKLLCYKGL